MRDVEPAVGDAERFWERCWQDPRERAAWSLAEPVVREVAAGTLRDRGVRRVLDLGCGVGRHALLLARAGFEVTALDGAPAALAVLRETAAREGLEMRIDAARMTELPYADRSFDYVLAFNVVYFGEPHSVRRTVDEIRRVLRLGGLYQGTMLSKRNTAFGQGRPIAPDTFDAGDGQPRLFCGAGELLTLFRGFEPLELKDREHTTAGAWHWHLLAERQA